ncbi:hypothetical protein [Halovivax sp.]|uniref:DUF7475 family protein n=1 Tax=Halovivax sp. TaxID=1935978 RepID=UPI0025B88ED5|nr:hypothetical protein [Halovivax sp.]
MPAPFDRLETATLTPLHWVGVVAALVTAGVHFGLGVRNPTGTFGLAFLFATVGFLVGIAAVLLAYRRRLVYLLGVPFTAGQLVLWYAFNRPFPPISTIEVVDKVAQAVLVAVLVILYRREREGRPG